MNLSLCLGDLNSTTIDSDITQSESQAQEAQAFQLVNTLCTQFINRYYASMLQQQQLMSKIADKSGELEDYISRCASCLRDDTVLCVLKLF